MTVFLFEYKLKCSTIFMFNINMQSLLKLYFYSAIVQETKLLKTDSRAMWYSFMDLKVHACKCNYFRKLPAAL